MTGLYHPELEVTGALFCAALSVYLTGVGRRNDAVRQSYLRCLILVTCAGALDVLRCYLNNLYGNRQNALFPLMLLQVAVRVAELFAAASFVPYARGKAGADKKSGKPLLAALALTAAGVLCKRFLPYIPAETFGASVAMVFLYFSLETPPYVELRSRIRELEQATVRAEEEKQRALLADRGMNDFLANMSHEIRTPLTAILGYNEVILNNAEEEDVKEYAEDIRNAGNTLLYIVGDILDFSKIESGELALSIGEYRLHDVLENLDNMIRKKARDKGLEYRTDIDPAIPDCLLGDGIRVSQILLNLLNNAVKYTQYGYVQLALSAERIAQDGVLLKADVEDSGIGIREEDMDKLFKAFSRFDELKNREVEGTGLGLTITSRLLELMGGTITAASTYGKGSIFSVTIPQIIVADTTIGQYAGRTSGYEGNAEDELLAPDVRILVVDDNQTNRTVVAELLAHTLMTIDTADGGEQCLELVKTTAYDIILMDQMMPHLSGPKTLLRLKELGEENRSRDAAVIAFTADAVAGARERLLSLGFDDYLSKPVTVHSLIQTIRPHLPSDKKLKPGMRGYEEARNISLARREGGARKTKEQMALEQLEGIDLAQALSICGTKEILYAAVRDFYLTIQSQADLIERYSNEGDIRNYTIKVHALKSAANVIGARKLSDDAAYLERMGNRNRTEELAEKTPALLALYRSYLDKLKVMDPDYEREEEKEPIAPEELDDAYEEIRMLAEQFEFDGIDAIMETLSEYAIPQERKAQFDAIRIAVTDVNREALLKLLAPNASAP